MGSDFVCYMEDVLDLYEEEIGSKRSVICFDDGPYQLVSATQPSQPITA